MINLNGPTIPPLEAAVYRGEANGQSVAVVVVKTERRLDITGGDLLGLDLLDSWLNVTMEPYVYRRGRAPEPWQMSLPPHPPLTRARWHVGARHGYQDAPRIPGYRATRRR